ncbi:MAG: type IV toxin-antitoxin system AbiEi family antitoxin domain-containing protein [Sphingomicrobium sp.]
MPRHIPAKFSTQGDRIRAILARKGMVRLSEFKEAGITATSVSRLEQEGTIVRLGRGLYQLSDAPYDPHHELDEVAKLVPKGIICLVSALAFHDLTDRQPRRVWVALGTRDWRPRLSRPPVRYIHYAESRLRSHVDHHAIEGVEVPITNPARTIVDLFKYRRTVGDDLAIEGLKEGLRTRKVNPALLYSIAEEARQLGVMRPYLEAFSHG